MAKREVQLTDRQAAALDAAEVIHRAIADMLESDRPRAVAEAYDLGVPVQVIADELGVTRGTVYVWLRGLGYGI